MSDATDVPTASLPLPEAGRTDGAVSASGLRFKCPQCGARLEFAPKAKSLACPYCGHVENIPQSAEEITENDLESALATPIQEVGLGDRSQQVRCDVCGAEILLSIQTKLTQCPYCASTIRNEPVAAASMIPPRAVLPFRLVRKEATAAFNSWLAGLWFAPSDLTRAATAGQLFGLYVPYWTFDAATISHYRGERGERYHETETVRRLGADGKETFETRQVPKMRWWSAWGRVDLTFDDVLVPASRTLPTHMLGELEPWDVESLAPFDESYLPGFVTERYQVDLAEGFELARKRMDAVIAGACRRDIGGDDQRLHDVKTQYLATTYKHVLFPVWHAAYRYHGKAFHFVVNARTAEVQGDRPISAWKVTFAVIGAVIVAAVIALVMNQ